MRSQALLFWKFKDGGVQAVFPSSCEFGEQEAVMEAANLHSQRLSPLPTLDQFTPAPANSFEVGSASLFPYLENDPSSVMSNSVADNAEMPAEEDTLSRGMDAEW